MVPMEYRHASQDYDEFLAEVAEKAGLATRNQAYTMVQGVLLAFRRRLAIEEAIVFTQVLPPMLLALFVQDWDPSEPRKNVWDRASLTKEVQQLRGDHNFSPDTAMGDVAAIVRRHVDVEAFNKCLSRLSRHARDYSSSHSG